MLLFSSLYQRFHFLHGDTCFQCSVHDHSVSGEAFQLLHRARLKTCRARRSAPPTRNRPSDTTGPFYDEDAYNTQARAALANTAVSVCNVMYIQHLVVVQAGAHQLHLTHMVAPGRNSVSWTLNPHQLQVSRVMADVQRKRNVLCRKNSTGDGQPSRKREKGSS